MSVATTKTTVVTTPIQNKPFTSLRIQMYTFVVNSGFIFKHLLNVLEKYSSICIFHLQPSNTQTPTVTVKAVIPEKTVVADIPVHVNVYMSTVDVHVSERAEHTHAQPVVGCGWKSNTEHLQFTVAMSKLYDWLNDARSKITTSDQLQFVFYCWGERNLLQMYDYNSMVLRPGHFHQLIHKWHEGLIDENEEELDEKHFHVQKKGKKGPKTIDSDDDDEDVDDDADEEVEDGVDFTSNEMKSETNTNAEHTELKAVRAQKRKWNQETREKPLSTQLCSKKARKQLSIGIKKPKTTRNKSKPKKSNKSKSIKQQSSSKQQREPPRSVVFHSRPFVDRFLFIPSILPKESEVVLSVSTSEFHSICRDLALGGNLLSMMKDDEAFYMSTSGEPGTVVFEFLENPFLDKRPHVPSVFNCLSVSRLTMDTVNTCHDQQQSVVDPVFAGLGVPKWFQDLAVPPSFEFCNTLSWSHLPTCIERLKCVRNLEIAEKDVSDNIVSNDKSPSPVHRNTSISDEHMSNTNAISSLVKQEESTNHCNTMMSPLHPLPPLPPLLTHTSRHQTKSTATATNFQSCYSLTLHKSELTLPQSRPESINTSNSHLSTKTKETYFLLRLLKMCTKEFSSKSLSSFPCVQLRFTAGRFLVLSLSEPVINHGMSIHVYISPVS